MTNTQARGGLSGGADETEGGSRKAEIGCSEARSAFQSAIGALGAEEEAATRQPAAIIPFSVSDESDRSLLAS